MSIGTVVFFFFFVFDLYCSASAGTCFVRDAFELQCAVVFECVTGKNEFWQGRAGFRFER